MRLILYGAYSWVDDKAYALDWGLLLRFSQLPVRRRAFGVINDVYRHDWGFKLCEVPGQRESLKEWDLLWEVAT